jgi:hypothetical protein
MRLFGLRVEFVVMLADGHEGLQLLQSWDEKVLNHLLRHR